MKSRVRLTLILLVVLSTAVYDFPVLTVVHGAPPSGDFTWNPQHILAGGNDSFTATASAGVPPYTFSWNFGDGRTGTGNQTTHIYAAAGNYTTTLTITDSVLLSTTLSHRVEVRGSPIISNGWRVNWNITDFHGVEISNATYNGVLTIRDALYTGVLVTYSQPPRGQNQCLFFDDLGKDDLDTSIAGFSLQFSTDPSNPWFQIRASFNPSGIGYNYTTIWRFYQDGRWDAEIAVGHLGCGWNHIYQPHLRVDLDIGNANRNFASQYMPSGNWQNLIWEGNYTDNGLRDQSQNSTQWRFGDGQQYYSIASTVYPWATDLPRIPSKVYLVRARPSEIVMTMNPADPRVDPILFANGELAYRQNLALWFLPSFWDRWLGFGSPVSAPPIYATVSFYPHNI